MIILGCVLLILQILSYIGALYGGMDIFPDFSAPLFDIITLISFNLIGLCGIASIAAGVKDIIKLRKLPAPEKEEHLLSDQEIDANIDIANAIYSRVKKQKEKDFLSDLFFIHTLRKDLMRRCEKAKSKGTIKGFRKKHFDSDTADIERYTKKISKIVTSEEFLAIVEKYNETT